MAKMQSAAEKYEKYIGQVEDVQKALESLRGKYMADAKPFHEDIKQIYLDVKSAGLSSKVCRGLVKRRALNLKVLAIPEALDLDEQAIYDDLADKLGPLGRAAAHAAGHDPTPAAAHSQPDAAVKDVLANGGAAAIARLKKALGETDEEKAIRKGVARFTKDYPELAEQASQIGEMRLADLHHESSPAH